MNVRDALEADAEALATIADSPTDVMRNLVHDRTVRVAERAPADGPDVTSDTQFQPSPEDLLGFVSFDARADTVHVTQIDGATDTCERLLAEPVRFAEREGMAVEALVPADDETATDALKSLQFDRQGPGPRFGDAETVLFRLEP